MIPQGFFLASLVTSAGSCVGKTLLPLMYTGMWPSGASIVTFSPADAFTADNVYQS